MDYHKNRFEDHSLIIEDSDKWLAVLPGDIKGNEWTSHSGLSYGGLISGFLSQRKVLKILSELIIYFRQIGVCKIRIKLIPDIYCGYSQQAIHYALFNLGFDLIRRDASSTIFLDEKHKIYKGRISSINRALKNDILINESNDYKQFMILENEILQKKYNVNAVHTEKEIQFLAENFRDNIKLIIATKNSEILAGGIVYMVDYVMHLQYFSANKKGATLGASDLVIKYCLDLCKKNKYKIFDFGISSENNGLLLNEGLNMYKESFGAVTTIADHYEKSINE